MGNYTGLQTNFQKFNQNEPRSNTNPKCAEKSRIRIWMLWWKFRNWTTKLFFFVFWNRSFVLIRVRIDSNSGKINEINKNNMFKWNIWKYVLQNLFCICHSFNSSPKNYFICVGLAILYHMNNIIIWLIKVSILYIQNNCNCLCLATVFPLPATACVL